MRACELDRSGSGLYQMAEFDMNSEELLERCSCSRSAYFIFVNYCRSLPWFSVWIAGARMLIPWSCYWKLRLMSS
jgi:hypothetical protein